MACSCHLSRRSFLGWLGAAATLPLAGCDDFALPFDIVGDDQVARLGLESWRQIRSQVPLSENPRYQSALAQIGGRLLGAAGQSPAEWEMRVFAGDSVNAFALPGRKIGVFEGMFGVAGSEGQLAAVVGHEIGHHLADHAKERLNVAALKQLGLDVVQVALDLGEVAYSREIAAALGLGVEIGFALPYSRGHELEADRLGLDLMKTAGYDRREAVALWRRMEREGEGRLAFLSTHPAPGARAEALRKIIETG
jgi:predicted Zn-dependent protease